MQNSTINETPETGEVTNEAAPSALSVDGQIAALLGGSEPGDGVQDDGETAETPQEGGAGPETEEPSAEAEKPGLDYAAEIPLSDGTKITLGKLKDYYQERATHELKLVEHETAVMRTREQAELLLSYVQNLPPEVQAAASSHAVANFQHEAKLLVAAIPELGTADGAARVKATIYSLTDEYGVSRRVVDRITDHVTVKMLHDYARLKQQIREAKGLKPLPNNAPRGKTPGKLTPDQLMKQKIAAAKNGSRQAQDDAINALLRNG